jgi:hypothetical protein
MLAHIGTIMESGLNNQIGQPGLVVPLHNFYGLEFVDSRIRGLAACFASFQFVDVVCNWQSFSFLTDAGIVYAVLLIESARKANIMTLASVYVYCSMSYDILLMIHSPLLLGYNMQFFGIGVLMALYCFVHYVHSPIENFRTKDMRLTDMGYTASVLPVLLLTHYVPNFGSYLTFIDPNTRHVWNWIWQPFPVYISVLQFVLKKTVMPNTSQNDRVENVNRDLPTIYFTIGSFCALSACTWYSISNITHELRLTATGGIRCMQHLCHGPHYLYQILKLARRATSTFACSFSSTRSSPWVRASCGCSTYTAT